MHHANQVDGKPRQRGSTKDMLFNVPTLIAFISSIVALQDGDLILCGTPPGVGAVQAGQTMQAGMETGAGAVLGTSACRRRAIAQLCIVSISLILFIASCVLVMCSLAVGSRHCSLSREIKIVMRYIVARLFQNGVCLRPKGQRRFHLVPFGAVTTDQEFCSMWHSGPGLWQAKDPGAGRSRRRELLEI